MLARSLLLASLVAGASGCKGELNLNYCIEHPEDQDCRGEGLIRLDAPTPLCMTNAECVDGVMGDDPTKTICDTTAQVCVQCLDEVMEQPCEAMGQKCGIDHQCHGCILDSDCASSSGVCLPTMSCALESDLLFVSPTGGETTCTKDAPCELGIAVSLLTAQRRIIKMLPGQYREEPVVINVPFGVQILGDGATFTPDEAGAAITISGANVEIAGLTITGAAGNGIVCAGTGTMTLARVTVAESTGWAVETAGCSVTIERSRFTTNGGGGLLISAGMLEIRNNIIDGNGNGNIDQGNVLLRNVVGRFVFNTIVLNLSRSGNRVGGLSCTAGGGTFDIRRNIIAGNGAANNEVDFGTCTGASSTNFIANDEADVRFASLTTFKLSANSPNADVLNDPLADADCKRGAGYIDDHEGQPRPVVYCDRGADEYRP